MGERTLIAFYLKGHYVISLYDQWGWSGDDFYDVMKQLILDLSEKANDFFNFLTMFVHAYRERRGFKPDDGYSIYMSILPYLPDYDVLCYDFTKREFWTISPEEITEDVKKTYGPLLKNKEIRSILG